MNFAYEVNIAQMSPFVKLGKHYDESKQLSLENYKVSQDRTVVVVDSIYERVPSQILGLRT